MKKKLGILIALVIAISLCLTPVMVGAVDTYDTKLVLENKTPSGEWPEILNDGIRGVLWFNSSGYEFEYKFFAKGLEGNTNYSLCYYADPWPGDNSLLIAQFETNGAGKIPKWQTGSVDLGTNLPVLADDNYPTGAKIWLVPTDLLSEEGVEWQPTRMLFERNLITYRDTGRAPGARAATSFDVFVRFGYDSTRYDSNGALVSSIEAAGDYNDAQYMLYVPAGCVVEGATARVNWLMLTDINDSILTFVGGDASFSMPGTLYKAEGGKIWQDRMTSEWAGEGEWVEVGSFTSIVDGVATLE